MLFVKDQTTKLAVTGFGGVGKTQVVLELIYRVRERNKTCSVIWIPAMRIEGLQQAYRDVGQRFGIPGWEHNKSDIKKLVKEYLSKEITGH
jgi:Cdc6-like AAA superfamily ATPase